MLIQCCRQWTNIGQTLGQSLVFVGLDWLYTYTLCTILSVDTPLDNYTGTDLPSPYFLVPAIPQNIVQKQDLARLEHLHNISSKTTYISVNICINIV